LPARKRMEKSCDRPRIAPVERRVGHSSQRHVKIECRSEQPAKAARQCGGPFGAETPGLRDEISRSNDNSQAKHIEQNEKSGLKLKPIHVMSDSCEEDSDIPNRPDYCQVAEELHACLLRLYCECDPDE